MDNSNYMKCLNEILLNQILNLCPNNDKSIPYYYLKLKIEIERIKCECKTLLNLKYFLINFFLKSIV